MTVVTLEGLERLLGAPGPIDAGAVEATYWAGSSPFIQVGGSGVIFPPAIRVDIVDGNPVAELEMEPTDGICCVRWMVRSYNGNFTLIRYTSIPATGPVAFGDLVVVDPATFSPVEPVPTLVATIDQRIDEYLGDGIGEEVAAYLEANPPTSGLIHTQGAALGAWVIPHTLGRLPNVAVYVGGELVDTDITATASVVTITFATPTAGVAVLN